MGVYIKGTNKSHVLKIFQANGLSPKLMGIELIEVKEPHGRLIDAEEASETMMYEMCGTGYQGRAIEVLRYEFYTPTIIEAEGE